MRHTHRHILLVSLFTTTSANSMVYLSKWCTLFVNVDKYFRALFSLSQLDIQLVNIEDKDRPIVQDNEVLTYPALSFGNVWAVT